MAKRVFKKSRSTSADRSKVRKAVRKASTTGNFITSNRKQMRKVSKKQSKINNALKKVYKEIELERGKFCTGCNRSDLPLSHSHIIPRSRRKDLVTDPNNITYHCLGDTTRKGCHQLWESGGLGDKERLLDYHKNMEYILEVDTEYYFILTELTKD